MPPARLNATARQILQRRFCGSTLAARGAVRAKAANVSDSPTAADSLVGLSTSDSRMAQVHVLIGAADEMSRRLREALLRMAGCRVSLARTGFEAIVKASCHVPDVILLDDSLGDIDAAETRRLIATCPVTSAHPRRPARFGQASAAPPRAYDRSAGRTLNCRSAGRAQDAAGVAPPRCRTRDELGD